MRPDDKAAAAAIWWRELQPDPARGSSGDRAALARLRRCGRPEEAAGEAAALDLARRVGVRRGNDPALGDALLTAIVLAHVRENESIMTMARQLGASGREARTPMSPLRLARLLASDTGEERILAFRRAVALVGQKVNVRDLAAALLDWSEKRRIAWAFDYHYVPPPGTEADCIDTNRPATGDQA